VRDGRARVERRLAPGEWRLLVLAPGAALLDGVVRLSDRDVDLGELTLEPTRRIAGRVVRAGGALPESVRVGTYPVDPARHALLGQGSLAQTAGPDGRYEIDAGLGPVDVVAWGQTGAELYTSRMLRFDPAGEAEAPLLELRPRIPLVVRSTRPRPGQRWRTVVDGDVEWQFGEFSRGLLEISSVPPGPGRFEVLDERGAVRTALPFEARAGPPGVELVLPD
jgi:hypothetical protein